MHAPVSQAPAPLKLQRVNRAAPEGAPPSYPMLAVDMGVDLFETADTPEETPSGLIRKAPYQYGHWALQPLYNAALTVVLDTKTNTFFTRSLQPVLPQWNAEKLMRQLHQYNFPDDVRWLQCVRVAGVGDNENNHMRFALVVIDYIGSGIHTDRRRKLESVLPQLGIRTMPEDGGIYLIPEYPECDSLPEDLWSCLHIMNADWGRKFYGGITMKQANAPFYMQMDDCAKQSLRWNDHKFLHPLPDANTLLDNNEA